MTTTTTTTSSSSLVRPSFFFFVVVSFFFFGFFGRKKERNPVKMKSCMPRSLLFILFQHLRTIGGGGVTREKAKKKIGFPQFVHARARPREGKRKKGTENRSRATPGFEKKSRARRRRRPPPPPPLLI